MTIRFHLLILLFFAVLSSAPATVISIGYDDSEAIAINPHAIEAISRNGKQIQIKTSSATITIIPTTNPVAPDLDATTIAYMTLKAIMSGDITRKYYEQNSSMWLAYARDTKKDKFTRLLYLANFDSAAGKIWCSSFSIQ